VEPQNNSPSPAPSSDKIRPTRSQSRDRRDSKSSTGNSKQKSSDFSTPRWADVVSNGPETADKPSQAISKPQATTPPQLQNPQPKPPKPAGKEIARDVASVFVSNLPFSVTEEQVRTCFLNTGEIKSIDLYAQRGHCFIHFANADSVKKVFEVSKEGGGLIIDGRALRVEERKQKTGSRVRSFERSKDFKDKEFKPSSHDNGVSPKTKTGAFYKSDLGANAKPTT